MIDLAADDRWYSDLLDKWDARGEAGATNWLPKATCLKPDKPDKPDLAPVWGQFRWESTSLLFKLGAGAVYACVYLGMAWLLIILGLMLLIFADRGLGIKNLPYSEWPILIGAVIWIAFASIWCRQPATRFWRWLGRGLNRWGSEAIHSLIGDPVPGVAYHSLWDRDLDHGFWHNSDFPS